MDTSKATPRPWTVETNPTPMILTDLVINCRTDADHSPIHVARMVAWNGPEAAANAALIVRAVNAHDTLVAALRAMLAVPDIMDRTEHFRAYVEAQEQARAALALADGGVS
jgi:hypothetical protein